MGGQESLSQAQIQDFLKGGGDALRGGVMR